MRIPFLPFPFRPVQRLVQLGEETPLVPVAKIEIDQAPIRIVMGETPPSAPLPQHIEDRIHDPAARDHRLSPRLPLLGLEPPRQEFPLRFRHI